MFFWVAAALLTFAASMAVLLPLSRRAGAEAGASELNVYRDQLSEIEKDVSRGLLASGEAEQARAEIARRILKAGAAEGSAQVRKTQGGLFRVLGAAAVVSIPLVSWGLYATLGSPGLPEQPLAARMTKDPASSTPIELVARAEAQLAANPDDLRGWDVLAPIYVKMQRFDDAATAYRNALRLGGSSAVRQAGLGEALVYAAGGTVTVEAQRAFEAALSDRPGDPKARFFLAMAKAQEGDTAAAVNDWKALAGSLEPDSPWRGAALAMLARAGEAEAAPGPDRQQIDEAQQMKPEDQAAMIEGMVSGLDQKLRENPNDIPGWQRLIRSYLVLGKQDEAADALSRAVEALGPGSAGASELTGFAKGLGMKVAP
ncbi:MAG: c-type cytochrome biogenesis protein CcmI [Rhizobiaceae bacterium]|nr:c-type cytochrome biogenesis protein CcmI [Rhizobiaceae bacterium]